MRILTALALLLAVTAAGADEARVQATATILSRCELHSARLETGNGAAVRSVARCTGNGTRVLPYRVSYGDTATLAGLPPNTRVTLATTPHGQVLTIEF